MKLFYGRSSAALRPSQSGARLNAEQAASSVRRAERGTTVTFWLAAILLVIVFLAGGASRLDVQSLVILYPSAVLACAAAAVTLRLDDIVAIRGTLMAFGCVGALCAVHLIPLPPVLWHGLPGREEIVEVDRLAGIGDIWRPLTLTPMNGWHALASLTVPLAMLLFGAQLTREQLRRFLLIVIAIGAFSGVLGVAQAIGGSSGRLYVYQRTNVGNAVGLFANRNHAALFLALQFPLLALWASEAGNDLRKSRLRLLTAVTLSLILFPLILITGSRSGLITAVLAMAGALLIVASTPLRREIVKRTTTRIIYLGGLAAIVGMGLLAWITLRMTKAEAVQRLLGSSFASETRASFWPTCIDLLWKYFPIGSGSGSFVEIYQIAEPFELLDSDYLNHAHNDFLEIGITFGLPGIALLIALIALYLRRSFILWFRRDGASRSVSHARTAGILMFLIAAASVFDYPLRTASMACLFALFTLWFVGAGRDSDTSLTRPLSTGEDR